MSVYSRVALLLMVAATAACVPRPTMAPETASHSAPRTATRAGTTPGAAPAGIPLRIGPPARPGIDGPLPQTGIDTPALPFEAASPVTRTTAEMMAEAARRPARRAEDRPTFRKVRPDRRQLPNRPDALAASQWPLRGPRLMDRGQPAAAPVSQGTPNTDVARSTDTPFNPPDTMGDVGPEQVLVVLNGRMRTISKLTGLADGVLNLDPDVFFNAANTGDPRVRFDRRLNRWYVLVFTIELPNRYLLAVSSSGVITASTTWTIHQWLNTRTVGGVVGAASCFGDYPTLGVDEDALYIGVNQFCGADIDNITFESSSAYVVRKSALPGALVVSQFDALMTATNATGPYTPQGVDNVDGNTNMGYFIGVDGGIFGMLQMRRISNPGSTPTISGNVSMGGLVGMLSTAAPVAVAQPGVSQRLDGLDDRLLQATIRNGRLWTAHQIGVDASGVASDAAIRNGIRWYEIENLGTIATAPAPNVRQAGTVFDPSAGTLPLSYWMGTLNVNAQGHVALGMTRGGAGTTGFANAAFTGRLATDPPGTMAPPTLFTSNTGFTLNTGIQPGYPVKRWGDYSYTSVDPVDDTTMWTLQEYVSANNIWAVRLVKLTVGAPESQDRPLDLTVSAIVGNRVTLRWRWTGALPDSYVLKGGVAQGQTLATLPTGSSAPAFTFDAPSGIFFVRIAGVRAGVELPVSDDVRIVVNRAEVPSTPITLLGTAKGQQLALSWVNTLNGGIPTGSALDVTGAAILSQPLPLGERFTFSGVPGGTYTFRVRATNATGSSPASAPLTLTFPGVCQTPTVPEKLQAYAVGRTLFVRWESPSSGPAVSSYVLGVSGAFNGNFGLTAREISSAVPPGSYTFTVSATGDCGTSAATSPVTVVVP